MENRSGQFRSDTLSQMKQRREEDAKIYFKYEYIMAGTAGELWWGGEEGRLGGSSLQGLVQICIAEPSEFVAGDKWNVIQAGSESALRLV